VDKILVKQGNHGISADCQGVLLFFYM